MTNHLPVRWGVIGASLLSGLLAAWAVAANAPETASAGAGPASAPATGPAGQVPASRPASETPLVRVGDKDSGVITQEEFNAYYFDGQPVPFERIKDQFGRELVERKWLLAYIEDHPELNVEIAVREQAEVLKKRENLKTDEELNTWLRAKRMTLEVWRRQWRIQTAKARLSGMGEKKAADEELLKKMFDAAPSEFNGTRLAVRHILIGTAVYDTPAEKRTKREKAEKIREELLSGKLKWEDAVKESTDVTKSINGNLGSFTRHQGLMEDLAAASFPLELNKVSEIVETPFGYHILELIRRDVGTRSFEESKAEMKRWLRREPYIAAIHEAAAKYPATGVQPPMQPTRPPWLPQIQPPIGSQTRPAFPRLPMTRPATRPAQAGPTTRLAPMRPGMPQPMPGAATRPVPMRPPMSPAMHGAATRPAPMRPATPPAAPQNPGGAARPPG